MKIAVIGATGQLGMDISQAFKNNGDEVLELGHEQIDIASQDSVKNALSDSLDVVVNTAAFHNVDKCEEEPVKAFEVNGAGARNLAYASNDLGFKLIHISTDYVFNGDKNAPYLEDDLPKPLNVYGNTKVSGEQFVQAISDNGLVMRVSGIYGKNPCRAKGGLNFVQLMLKLAAERPEIRVVDHEIVTPTSTVEIARQVVKVSDTDLTGICHATAEGSCSWYQFAKTIFEKSGVETNLNIAGPDEFPAKTPRPTYSVLENGLLKANNLNIFKSWEEGLEEYLGV